MVTSVQRATKKKTGAPAEAQDARNFSG